MALRGMRYLVALAFALAVICSLLVVHDLYLLHDAGRFNELLDRSLYARAGEHESPNGQVALAYALQRRGRLNESMQAYARIEVENDPSLAAIVVFNLATLYLEQAMSASVRDTDVTTPLIELAKENYRSLLRTDGGDWDAKYNLELAMRLAPEPADEQQEETITPERTPRAPRAPMGYGGLP